MSEAWNAALNDDDGDGGEGDYESNVERYSAQKDAVLFCIETGPFIKEAVEGAYSFLLQKVISNPSDMVGILLYNTLKTRNVDSGFKNISLLLDLDCPDAESIRNVRDLIVDEEALKEYAEPSPDEMLLSNVFFYASQLFTSKAANFNSKRLFLVTSTDDPHSSNSENRKSAIQRAKDLRDLGITLEPLFLRNPDQPAFDVTKFYAHILRRTGLEDEDELDDEETEDLLYTLPKHGQSFKTILDDIKRRENPKRSQYNILLEIAPNFSIGVKGYILFKKQEIAKSHWVYIKGEKPQLVKTHTELVEQTSASTLQKKQLKKAYTFGGSNVVFDPEELKTIKSLSDPIIRIIGFKNLQCLQFWHNIRPAYFIYPSEEQVTGSRRTFAALHRKLLESKKFGLALFVPRKTAAPVLSALIAANEELDKDKQQVRPAGIYVITLPFADDIRSVPYEITNNILVQSQWSLRDELADVMGNIAKHLRIDTKYSPEKYPNPGMVFMSCNHLFIALQWHYRILQAIALDEEAPEDPVDKTMPKYKTIDKRVGEYCRQWAGLLENMPTVAVSITRGIKRYPPQDSNSSANAISIKRGKLDIDKSFDSLNKMKVAELRVILQKNGVAPTGIASMKKAEVITYIMDNL